MTLYMEAARLIVQLLADILADTGHLATATAHSVIRFMLDLDTGKCCR
jgi:hypothetical protein